MDNLARSSALEVESSQALLDKALELALPLAEERAPVADYLLTKRRKATRRGTIWLGFKCNIRCHFCYYITRVSDATHPEYPFMSLDKTKEVCRTLVEVYGNSSVDIQGGEPTLYKDIYPLVSYCREIGLDPSLITNALVLEDRHAVVRYKEAGLRDFMVSIQGLGPVYDEIVQLRGAFDRQMRGLKNLQEVGIPFRFNCVMSKAAVPQLPQIAELGIRTGAQSVCFLNFSSNGDQRIEGMRSQDNVASISETAGFLDEALDKLAEVGVEGNVRRVPLCMVAPRHRQSVYTLSQSAYDVHENDLRSWNWTSLAPQRTWDGEPSVPPELGLKIRWGPLSGLRRLGRLPYLGPALLAVKGRLDRALAARRLSADGKPAEAEYMEEGKGKGEEQMRSYSGFRLVEACQGCDAKAICDGYYSDYESIFGDQEVKPIQMGYPIEDPMHFIRDREKRVHPNDLAWLDS
jgi:sulfatase maturation enzyme AslB (radical SAM superfamily)